MKTIKQIAKEFAKFNIYKLTAQNVRQNKELFTDLLRDQMREGKNAEGDARDYRSLDYAEEKRSLPSYRAPYPKVDLFLTGSFQDKLFIDVGGLNYFFDSKDSKADEIRRLEGEETFMLNNEKKDIARSINQELLINRAKKIFG